MYSNLTHAPKPKKVSLVKLPNESIALDAIETKGKKGKRIVKRAYEPIPSELKSSSFTIMSYNEHNIPVTLMPKRAESPDAQINAIKQINNKPKKVDNNE